MKKANISEDVMNNIIIQGGATARENTVDIVERIIDAGLEGDFAECGIGSGGQCAVMALSLESLGISGTKIHLYDSFVGHCMPDNNECEDYKKNHGVNEDVANPIPAKNTPIASIEQVKNNMNMWCPGADLVYHPGYFQTVLVDEHKRNVLPKLSFLRLDCNFHISTYFAFKYLYPMIVPGGYIVSDDWGNPFCQDGVHEVLDELKEDYPEVIPVKEQETTVWWKKHE